MTPRPAEVDAFTAAIAGAGRVRVRKDQLLRMWAAAAPRVAGEADQLPDLVRVLDDLASDGVLVLPAAASWDRSTRPALPKFVTCPGNRTAPTGSPWRSFPWRCELGWVASLSKLTTGQYQQLVAVNRWLGSDHDDDVVPMRVRSAEIFGNEKALDQLITSRLFAEGRLSLDLLRCRRFPPPITITTIGDGPDILVIENADAYWAAIVAAHDEPGPIGRVAWGAGRGFTQSIHALAETESAGGLWYWGDLDPEGIAIAAAAATTAGVLGLPGLRPAHGLWAAMATRPVQDPGTVAWDRTAAGKAWLGSELWDVCAPVREVGGRVAQESVPGRAIAAWLREPT